MRGEDVPDFFADEDQARRNALVLRDVNYLVDVRSR